MTDEPRPIIAREQLSREFEQFGGELQIEQQTLELGILVNHCQDRLAKWSAVSFAKPQDVVKQLPDVGIL